MNIHRALNLRQRLSAADFERWLQLFEQTIADHYRGPQAERALQIAGHIAANMQRTLAAESAHSDISPETHLQ